MKKLFLCFALMLSAITFAQVGIGTTSPHSSSILDLTATNKALLLPRVANSNAIVSPVNGMIIYAENPKCFKGYQDGAWVDLSPCSSVTTAMTFGAVTYQGVSVINSTGIGYNGEAVPTASTITVDVTTTEPTSYNFSATNAGTGLTYSATGSFAAPGTFPVILTHNTPTIDPFFSGVITMPLTGASNSINLLPRIDVKSIPASDTEVVNVTYGTTQTWMDRNLGARRAAIALNDVFSYGNHYQWGRPADGHEITVWNGTTLTAGRGFHNATTPEALATSDTPGHPNFILTNTGTFDWLATQADPDRWATANQGPCPAGYRLPTNAELTTEVTTYSIANSASAFASPLKFTVPGYRSHGSGSFYGVGSHGYYWSSSVSGTYASTRYFNSGGTNTINYYRAYGFSVRCLKD